MNDTAKRICAAVGRHHVEQGNCEQCKYVYEQVKYILSEHDATQQAETERLRAVYVAAQRVVRQTNCTTAYLLHDQLIQTIEAAARREEAT